MLIELIDFPRARVCGSDEFVSRILGDTMEIRPG